MKSPITLDGLRAIEAINQQGSFAAAAKVLFKVPSALTYTIAKLESDLNVVLFDRSKQRAKLTAAGNLFVRTRKSHIERCFSIRGRCSAIGNWLGNPIDDRIGHISTYADNIFTHK